MLSSRKLNENFSAAPAPLVPVAIALAGGIACDRAWGDLLPVHDGVAAWWIAGLALSMLATEYRFSRPQILSIAALAAVACLGGGWHHLRWQYVDAEHYARFAPVSAQPVCLEAIALERPKWQPAPMGNPLRALPSSPSSDLLIRVTKLRDADHWLSADGECRLRVAGTLTDIAAGDRLRVVAQFSRIEPPLNPGGYDWQAAERGAGHYGDLYCREAQCVEVIEPAAEHSLDRWFDAMARRCEYRLTRYVGQEQSGLAEAILLGARERLDSETLDTFLETGTVHLLVVSGLHVGSLAALGWFLLGSGLLPRRTMLVATAVVVIAYALVVGGRPPVARATVLVLLGIVAVTTARRVSPLNLLAAAAILVLAYNPSELFRSGTQLSFLSVAALVAYGRGWGRKKPLDPLEQTVRHYEAQQKKVLRWITQWAKRLALASLVIWLAAVPLVAYHFHVVTPLGVAVTPLVWPLVMLSLALNFVICTVAWVVPPVATVLGGVSAACLAGTSGIVDLAHRIQGGSFYVPGPPLWWLAGWYAGLAFYLFAPRRLPQWKLRASLAAVWIAAGYAVAGWNAHDEQLHCTFLAMGHGTSVVLEMPGGETILYDAGCLASPKVAADIISGFLWSRGKARIDAVVLSHADVDHYNAMPDLVERFDVGVVYVSPLMFDPWATQGQLTAPNSLKEKLTAAGVPLEEVWMNDSLRTTSSNVEIEVLHPPREGVVGRDNANSILLTIKYAGRTILLPGDLESPGLEMVTAEPPRRVDVLMAPHHGSSRSDPPGFAAWCTPEWTIVSGRRDDQLQQLTASSYRKMGSRVLHTADCGAARFTFAGGEVTVDTFR